MIQCDWCGKWIHPSCLGLPDSIVEEFGDSGKDWFCSKKCSTKSSRQKDWVPTRKSSKMASFPPHKLPIAGGDNSFAMWEKDLEEYDLPRVGDVSLQLTYDRID